ncbi:MAG: glycosyltransferase family 4 protein [Acetobacteraceae bacterium]|nr:glycosyltransferase family 4 protein [Acetobacteraceae bacterium]
MVEEKRPRGRPSVVNGEVAMVSEAGAMPIESRGVIFFDLTQLIGRVTLATPDGIGRVELAYAQHLLKKYPAQVRFIYASKRLVQIIPRNLAIRYIEQIDLAWKPEDTESDQLTDRIAGFLRVDRALLGADHDHQARRQSRRNRRLFLTANVLMGLALQSVRPRNLARYSNSEARNAYISVSNSTISSNWLTRWLARSPAVCCIILVHDIIPITNPEFTLPQATMRHLRYVRRVAESADTIIANSTYTHDCLKEFAAKVNLRLPVVEIARLGVDDSFTGRRPSLELSTPYFVFISTIEPRKNHTMLLQVWQRLAAKLGEQTPKLILIGRRGWEGGDGHPFVGPLLLDLLERTEALRAHVMECSNVPDQLLVKLLAGARAALFPSHVEGFGLPLAEALSLGTPVICSDIPPFREIACDVPEYVDPLAGRGWIRLVTEYTPPDSPKRVAQLERMRNFRPTRWSEHLAVLDSVLARAGVTAQSDHGPRRTPMHRPAPGPGAPAQAAASARWIGSMPRRNTILHFLRAS